MTRSELEKAVHYGLTQAKPDTAARVLACEVTRRDVLVDAVAELLQVLDKYGEVDGHDDVVRRLRAAADGAA